MPEILLVMRKPGNIRVLRQVLEAHEYTCTQASHPAALEALFEQPSPPDLALIDVFGLGEAVWSMCELLQRHGVPFIVLSSKQELDLYGETLRSGGAGILQKPVVKALLLKLIGSMTHAETP